MDITLDVPAVIDQDSQITEITINHVNKTASARVNINGQARKVVVDLTDTIIPAMTATQRTTVVTFLKRCALELWQVIDNTVVDGDITNVPDFG